MSRELFGRRVLAAFFIASFLFIALFSIAYGVAYWNYQVLSEQTNSLLISINRLDHILADFTCDDSLLVSSSSVFDQAALKLGLLERRFGKQDSRVLEQKKLYSELQYRHWAITRQFNEQCHRDFIPVLFFYSNLNDAIEDQSERVGFILTSFERTDSNRIMIYSFDAYLDSRIVENLTRSFNITSVPVVVVRDGGPLEIHNLRDLMQYV